MGCGMVKRSLTSVWSRSMARSLAMLQRSALRASQRAAVKALKSAAGKRAASTARAKPARAGPAKAGRSTTVDGGSWLSGMVAGPAGTRRYRIFRPPDLIPGERLPLLVMLHGCGQDAERFAASTRMNRIAARERFWVLYPEQDRLANPQSCWNWFDTRSGRALGEAALIMAAVDQVGAKYPVDLGRVAVAGLSAGASMAALLAAHHPARFKAVVMHSGVAPGAAHSTLTALAAMRGRRSVPALKTTPAAMAASWPALLVIQGDADTTVSPRNGRAAALWWAEGAGAQAGPARSVQRGKRYPITVTDFKVRGRAVATLVDISRLGHAWSGGAASQPYSDARGPDASRMVWAFAARQFRR